MNYLTTICSLVLGITLGVAFNHKWQLSNERSQLASDAQRQPINIYTTTGQYPEPYIINQTNTPNPLPNQPASAPVGRDQSALLKSLAKLDQQQKAIGRQLSEQSKEIQTLNFRQDMLSDKFIPLRKEANSATAEPNPSSGLTPLLPPIQ